MLAISRTGGDVAWPKNADAPRRRPVGVVNGRGSCGRFAAKLAGQPAAQATACGHIFVHGGTSCSRAQRFY